jgi:hypothetical protein
VEIPVEFRESFTGKKNLYAKVIDSNKAEDGFKRVGSFTIGNENKLPRIVSVSSELINQDVTRFTAIVEDENGFEDIASLRLVINKKISASDSVYLLFDAATEELFLRNDHGTRWIDSGNKKGRVLVNSQARIDTSRVHVNRSGNRMRISFPVEFTGKHGLKRMFAKATDISQAETKWVKAGTHTVSQITVADNGSLEDEFKTPFKNLKEKVSGKQGLHEYNVRKNRLMTHFTAFVGEKMVQAADTATWQGATRKIRVDGDISNAMGIAHSVQSESVVRLSGTMAEGLRLIYRHRNPGNYQFIDVQHDAKNNKRVVTSGYVVNGVEKVRKVVRLKNKGAGNEMSLTINKDAKSMKVTFNGNQVFAGAFKDSIQGKLALQTGGQLDIVYSIVK